MIEGNVWQASFEVYKLNWRWVLGYIGMVTVLAVLDRVMNVNSGTSIAVGLMASTILAIPAHIAVLTRLNPDQVRDWLKDRPKAFFSFVKRCLLIGLLGAVLPIVAAIVLIATGMHTAIVTVAAVCLWIFCGIAAFAKWGTMLPAIVADDDQTLSAAGKRGSKVFGYAFPRLLISFGLITILQIVFLMLIASLLGIDVKGSHHASVILRAVGAIIGGYQIVMTSVVLSRSYLRSRPAAPPSRRMEFALGR